MLRIPEVTYENVNTNYGKVPIEVESERIV